MTWPERVAEAAAMGLASVSLTDAERKRQSRLGRPLTIEERETVPMDSFTPIKLPADAIDSVFNLVRDVIGRGEVKSLRMLADATAGGKTVSDAFAAGTERDAKQQATVAAMKAGSEAGNKTVSDAFAAVAAGKPLDPKQAATMQGRLDGLGQGHKTQAATRAVHFSLHKTDEHTIQRLWTCKPPCGLKTCRWTKPDVVLGQGKGMIRFRPMCQCGVQITGQPQTVE
jgi:hypothetical protein